MWERKSELGAGEHEGRKRETKQDGSQSEKDTQEEAIVEGMRRVGGKQEEVGG